MFNHGIQTGQKEGGKSRNKKVGKKITRIREKRRKKALNEESSLKIHPRILIKNRIGPSIVSRGTPLKIDR